MTFRMHNPRANPGPRPYLSERRKALDELRFDHIDARPVGCTIGAEIGGVDLANLDDDTLADIRKALLAYRVIFFRDQDISVEAHRAFAERFGELEDHPFIPSKDGNPDVIRFPEERRGRGASRTSGTATSAGARSRRWDPSYAASRRPRTVATRSSPTWWRPTSASMTRLASRSTA